MVLLSKDNFFKITSTHILICLTQPKDFKIKVIPTNNLSELTTNNNVNFEKTEKTTGRPKQNQSTE